MPEAFEMVTPEISAASLAEPGAMRPFLSAAREKGFADEEAQMLSMLRAFPADETWVKGEGWSDQRKNVDVWWKTRQDVVTLGKEAAERFRASPDPHLRSLATKDLGEALAEFVGTHPEAMPAWRMSQALGSAISRKARGVKDGGAEQRKFVSIFWDMQHAWVGAAHCDVFTCDGLVAESLALARKQIGKPAPLTCKGGAEPFVVALERLAQRA